MNPILFFDGECGLCNRVVQRILNADTAKVLRFAPLSGETAKKMLPAERIAQPSTVVLWVNGKTYEQSSAVIHALNLLGGGASVVAGMISVFPQSVRDWGYQKIAANRQRFSKCELQSIDDRILP